MATFPTDAFTPEVCAWPKCEAERIPAGINVGVMIVGPDQWKFDALKAYALLTARRLQNAEDAKIAFASASAFTSASAAADHVRAIGTRYFASAEQSFIREFYEDVMNASLVDPVAARRGWDWGVQSYTDVGACRRVEHRDPTRARCLPGTTHVMSRRYNARPLDCARCPASIANIIVHYACSIKPWERKRSHWRTMASCDRSSNRTEYNPMCEPCLGNLTEGWFHAEDRMCATLRAAAESSPDVALAVKARC